MDHAWSIAGSYFAKYGQLSLSIMNKCHKNPIIENLQLIKGLERKKNCFLKQSEKKIG